MRRIALSLVLAAALAPATSAQSVSLDAVLGDRVPKPYTLLDVELDGDGFTELLAVHAAPAWTVVANPRAQTFYSIDVCADGSVAVSEGFALPPAAPGGIVVSQAELSSRDGVSVFKILDVRHADGDPLGQYALRYFPIPRPCR